jgi:hypothetical protein
MIKSQFLFAAALGIFLGCTQIPDDLRNGTNEEQQNVDPPVDPPSINTSWSMYTDVDDNGASTVANARDGNGKYIVIMQNANVGNVATILNYNLVKGGNPYAPFVGMELQNNGKQTNVSDDVSNCSNGYSYQYKGSAHAFMAKMLTVGDYNFHRKDVATSNTWQTAAFFFSDLRQQSWGQSVSFTPSLVGAFGWEIRGDISGTGTSGSLEIHSFRCF